MVISSFEKEYSLNAKDNSEHIIEIKKEKPKRYGFQIKCLHCGKTIEVPMGGTISTNEEIIIFNTSEDGIVITIKCEHCYNETSIQLFDILRAKQSI